VSVLNTEICSRYSSSENGVTPSVLLTEVSKLMQVPKHDSEEPFFPACLSPSASQGSGFCAVAAAADAQLLREGSHPSASWVALQNGAQGEQWMRRLSGL